MPKEGSMTDGKNVRTASARVPGKEMLRERERERKREKAKGREGENIK
jgi:hypothetical protein